MTRKEKQALANLETLITAPQQVGQLPVSRKLVTALNKSLKSWPWKKKESGIDEALSCFDVHPLGPGKTDPKYLFCECIDNPAVDPELTRCPLCDLPIKRNRKGGK